MAQELSQTQELQQLQQQQQRMTAQQIMVVRMLEMPLAQMEQNIQTELDENPALEGEEQMDDDYAAVADDGDGDSSLDGDGEDFEEREEREERKDELDSVLESLDSDDRLPTSDYERTHNHDTDADQEERVYGNMESFYDTLREQTGEQMLTERQELIMEYLIGSLDSDGLLRKELVTLADEIFVREYMEVTEDEIEKVLTILQSFDPAGIGAQSLQQCLLIQIFRKQPTPITKLMHTIISDHYSDFTKKHWGRIKEQLQLSDYLADEVFGEIRKLNPRPGAALGETMGRNISQVTPDFLIDTDENGTISITLNKGKMPELHVSRDFEEMIDTYRQNPSSMTRRDKEALVYAQQKVNRARSYIDAITQRQRTMISTMRAIASLQKRYILSGDESDLRPMILKDVADIAHVDISTVSRVCNSKYAEMPWGILPLKSFFSDGYDTGNGEEVSTREIKTALKELVAREPKGKPFSDIKLAAEMKGMGYPIARRTVAKYREQLGIPPSHLRK